MRPAYLAIVTTAADVLLASAAFGQPWLTTYETPYYVIHTDLERDAVREAASRITAMAEMYHERTKGFAGRITTRLPFYLFGTLQDYYAAGGMEGTAGIYDGKKLMAVAGRETSGATWHIIQHEGFHQFVHAVIGGDIPVWVNEGLAEYFAQSIYTGDGYVTGVIPPARLARLQRWLDEGRFRSLADMMTTSYAAWNVGLNLVNYDQAWSMVHFLAHADDGRYQGAFNSFMKDVSRGTQWEHAWRKSFGTGTQAFEEEWRKYWTEMPANPTADLYAKATVATLTSFYARAFSQRQVFGSFEEFREAAGSGGLRHHPDDWLPPALLQDALKNVEECGDWQVRKRSRGYELVCTMADGTTLTGTFKIKNRRVKPGSVRVAAKPPRK